jgi:hypothetical protein
VSPFAFPRVDGFAVAVDGVASCSAQRACAI